MLDKFIDGYLVTPGMLSVLESDKDDEIPPESPDFVKEYSLLLLKYYILVMDIKDAVREGNGQRVNQLH